MSDRRRNEKEEEKREKEDEKRTEKQSEEKWRRDPVRGIMFAAILIWGGVVALITIADMVSVSWWQGWAVFLAGTGVILLLKAAVRLLRPEYRRPIGGTVIIGVILLGVGIGDIVGWEYTWPVILIIIGAVLVVRVFFRRR
jgi:fatty acid desaturase